MCVCVCWCVSACVCACVSERKWGGGGSGGGDTCALDKCRLQASVVECIVSSVTRSLSATSSDIERRDLSMFVDPSRLPVNASIPVSHRGLPYYTGRISRAPLTMRPNAGHVLNHACAQHSRIKNRNTRAHGGSHAANGGDKGRAVQGAAPRCKLPRAKPWPITTQPRDPALSGTRILVLSRGVLSPHSNRPRQRWGAPSETAIVSTAEWSMSMSSSQGPVAKESRSLAASAATTSAALSATAARLRSAPKLTAGLHGSWPRPCVTARNVAQRGVGQKARARVTGQSSWTL